MRVRAKAKQVLQGAMQALLQERGSKKKLPSIQREGKGGQESEGKSDAKRKKECKWKEKGREEKGKGKNRKRR